MVVENSISCHGGGPEGNQKGVQIEEKVASLLTELDLVVGVTAFPKWSADDRNKRDLQLNLNPEAGLFITDVFVQVKASTRGVWHFEEGMARMLKDNARKGKPQIDRHTWLMENRVILLVGDEIVSKTKATRRKVTDPEILDDFIRQLSDIDSYWRSKASQST